MFKNLQILKGLELNIKTQGWILIYSDKTEKNDFKKIKIVFKPMRKNSQKKIITF